jgi:TonB-linked SusC/RagA family outer membrane protein
VFWRVILIINKNKNNMKRICLIFFVILGLLGNSLHAQDRRVTGTVTDFTDGSTMPGVTVMVRGTNIGTVTDMNGRYELTVPADAVLVFSFIGMNTEDVTVGDRTIVDVAMVADVALLQEIVVTAIGVRRETKALGYSVQTVGSDEISRSGNLNTVNSLAGRVAGVNITNSSGAAGASTFMTIRGNASITGNNQPLFVVDGVPIDNSQITAGDPRNGANNLLYGVALSNRSVDINPEDIETINILKGGAATALYGLRAANGAVIITTKRGVMGTTKPVINFSSSVGFDQVSQLPELQNKYAQGIFGNFTAAGNLNPTTLVWGPRMDTLRYDGAATNLYYPSGNVVGQSNPNANQNLMVGPYDNVGNFFQTGVTYNNNLSIAGSSERTTYFLSLGHTSAGGIVPNNTFKRTNLTVAGESKLSSRFTSDARISYTNSGGVRIQQGSNTSGVMLALMRMPSNFDITGGVSDPVNDEAAYRLADGRQRNAYNGGGYDNPFWTVNMNQFNDDVHRITGHTSLTFNAADWLDVVYRVGTDFYSDRRHQHFARFSRTLPNGMLFEEQHFVRDINSDLLLNFNFNLTDDIGFTGLLGQNLYQTTWQRLYSQGDNLTVPDFYNLSNAATLWTDDTQSKKRTAAVYADFGFDFRSMIFVNITGRNEWSTTLPEENNSFFFPSVSGSFVFTELPALVDNNLLSFGKVRASYAQIANDAFVYATNPVYGSAGWGDGWTNGISFPGWGTAGFSMGTRLANPELRPEILTSFEVGFDLRFLQNRLGLDFTYYDNHNEDLILAVPIAKSSGYYTAAMNAAEMVNKGIEVTLYASPVRTTDFNWDFNVNFTKNTNEVLSLAEGVENVTLAGFVGAQARAVVGESYGSIFGEYWVKHENGERLINEDGFPMMSEDESNLGNVLPNWTMGINNSFSFRNVSLSFLFDIKNGGVMWNGTRGAMYYFGSHKNTESREPGDTYVFEGVLADGTPNTKEVVKDIGWYVLGEGSGFTGPTEEFIEKTDWVRLRELTLSYSLGRNIASRAGLTNAEIFFTGRNLWLSTPYTGVDPETSLIGAGNGQGLDYFNMPGTKSYMFGLRLTL